MHDFQFSDFLKVYCKTSGDQRFFQEIAESSARQHAAATRFGLRLSLRRPSANINQKPQEIKRIQGKKRKILDLTTSDCVQ
jgi:hypothetical protein